MGDMHNLSVLPCIFIPDEIDITLPAHEKANRCVFCID